MSFSKSLLHSARCGRVAVKKMEVEGRMLGLFSQERVTRLYGKEMRKEGFEQGYKEGKLEAVLSLLKNGIITEDDATEETGMTAEDLRRAVVDLA